MSFEGDIIEFTNKSIAEADKIRRAVIIELFSAVIDDTPVDTGRLRGNWLTSVNKPREDVLVQNDPNGTRAKNKIINNLGAFGDSVYLSNNLPYANVAEYGEWNGPTDKVNSQGFSKQAPAGMVRKNAIRFQQVFKREASK